MTKELAILTKEQAEAVEGVRARHSKEYAVELFFDDETWGPWTDSFAPINDMTADTFIRSLYVGYTVEKTQEEREADVKAYFEENVSLRDNSFQSGVGRARFGGKTDAIKSTLDLLGITIAGVNG